jgi:hypothetical protein
MTPSQALANILYDLSKVIPLNGSQRILVRDIIVKNFQPLMDELASLRRSKPFVVPISSNDSV